jgi:hypothetical protein
MAFSDSAGRCDGNGAMDDRTFIEWDRTISTSSAF